MSRIPRWLRVETADSHATQMLLIPTPPSPAESPDASLRTAHCRMTYPAAPAEGNAYLLLEELVAEVNLVLDGATVDLDLHHVRLLLRERGLRHLFCQGKSQVVRAGFLPASLTRCAAPRRRKSRAAAEWAVTWV